MTRLLLLLLLASAALAGLDPNEKKEALRHLGIVRKEASALAQLASKPETTRLLEATRALDEVLVSDDPAQDELVDRYDALEDAARVIEPLLPTFPRGGGAGARYSNIRWSVQRIATLLNLEDEERPAFTVGPVSAEQAQTLDSRLTALLDRAGELGGALEAADPEIMYRNLLISQMQAFVQPAATLRVALRDPWWTPEAYQAVTQVTRLIDLTKNETRTLTPPLVESLRRVWAAGEELVAAANDIEKGARGTGPDATVNYLPRPRGR